MKKFYKLVLKFYNLNKLSIIEILFLFNLNQYKAKVFNFFFITFFDAVYGRDFFLVNSNEYYEHHN